MWSFPLLCVCVYPSPAPEGVLTPELLASVAAVNAQFAEEVEERGAELRRRTALLEARKALYEKAFAVEVRLCVSVYVCVFPRVAMYS